MDADQLIADLRLLRADFAGLGERLAAAADDLKASGSPVSVELYDEIVEGRNRFIDLCEKARHFLNEMAGDSAPNDMRSLEHIEELVRDVRASRQRFLDNQLCREAQVLIARTAFINHRDPSKRTMLNEVHRRGRDLMPRLVDVSNAERCDLARSVISGIHPLAALLRLMADVSDADESLLEAWEHHVEEDFGKSVRIAATSRRLFIAEDNDNDDNASSGIEEHVSPVARGELRVVDEATLSVSDARSPEPPDLIVQGDIIAVSTPEMLSTNNDSSFATHVDGDAVTKQPSIAELECSVDAASPPDDGSMAVLPHETASHRDVVDYASASTIIADSFKGGIASASMEASASTPDRTIPLRSEEATPAGAAQQDAVGKNGSDVLEVKDSREWENIEALAKESSEPIPHILEELVSFQRFCETYYLDGRDKVDKVPWKIDLDAFVTTLNALALQELAALRLPTAWLLSKAAENLGGTPSVRTHDIESCAALCETSASSLSSRDDKRSYFLRAAVKQTMQDVRLPAFLEAIRPTRGESLSPTLIDQLLEQSDFHSVSLREMVRKALNLNGHGVSLVATLKERLAEHKPEPSEDIRRKVDTAREHFHAEIMRLWSAAGGNIKTTHCREAWDCFMEAIQPIVKDLFPRPTGKKDWDTAQMDKNCRAIFTTYRKIADRREAKHEDRRRMDRAVQRIVDMAGEINDLMERLQKSDHRAESHTELLIPIQELRTLLECNLPEDPIENLCIELLREIFADDDKKKHARMPSN
jgi:hypothetical protein